MFTIRTKQFIFSDLHGLKTHMLYFRFHDMPVVPFKSYMLGLQYA